MIKLKLKYKNKEIKIKKISRAWALFRSLLMSLYGC